MNFLRFDEVDSTNETAKRLIADRSIKGDAVVVARSQTAGRGTQGRAWLSPCEAGIYMSVVMLDVGRADSDTALFTLAAGVACAETLQRLTGVEARLKPVNDLIVGEAKLGGILTEAHVEQGRVTAVITGIGVNTHIADRRLPSGSMPVACLEECMTPERFAAMDWKELICKLAGAVWARQSLVTSGKSGEVRRLWEALAVAPAPTSHSASEAR